MNNAFTSIVLVCSKFKVVSKLCVDFLYTRRLLPVKKTVARKTLIAAQLIL